MTRHPRPEWTQNNITGCPRCAEVSSKKEALAVTVKTGMCLSNPYHMCPKENLTKDGCTCKCHNSPVPYGDPPEVVELLTKHGKGHLVTPRKPVQEAKPKSTLVLKKRKPNARRTNSPLQG
jgi:hypothetical protein